MIRSAISPKPKLHKCRVCHDKFEKTRSIQPTCEKFECKVEYAERVAAKSLAKRVGEQRKADAARKQDIKRRADYLAEAQAAVNAYVRERDADLPCISCGRHHEGQYHAGHYLSRGACPALRFNLDNIHKQCAPCNNHLSGNAVLYRIGLIAKIGLERVEWLEGPHEPAKWSIEDLKAIRTEFKNKLKELKGAA